MAFFRKKLIYFIRHGQSANNASNLRQGPTGKLSEEGVEQSRFVGERLKKNRIDVMLVSPYERAKETGSIINEILKKPLEYTDLLVERKNPSEIVGKNADSPEVKKIMDLIDRSFHDNTLRYSDEENFEDLKSRAKKLLSFLEKRREQHILCVSHRIFLKMVLSYIEEGEKLDSHRFAELDLLNSMNNAAITVCSYTPIDKLFRRNPWKILVFNDYGRIK